MFVLSIVTLHTYTHAYIQSVSHIFSMQSRKYPFLHQGWSLEILRGWLAWEDIKSAFHSVKYPGNSGWASERNRHFPEFGCTSQGWPKIP